MARPTKFTEERERIVIDALRAGLSRYAAAGMAKVDEASVRHWCERFSGFSEACRVAEQEAAARMESVIVRAAAAPDKDMALQWLRRRRRADWGDNVVVDVDREVAELLSKLAGRGEDPVSGSSTGGS